LLRIEVEALLHSFETAGNFLESPVQSIALQQYVVSPDGKRFLMNSLTEDASASPITVILNWKAKP
jgi:hypothetical protein